jgi:ABC-2 type transport system ATP-binding protein
MSQKPIIKIKDLIKSYDSTEVLNGINIEIYPGEIFCLLGSDESGKTTLIEILVGLKKSTSGEIVIGNFNLANKTNLREIKKISGVLLKEFFTHDNLTVKENILFWGKMYEKMIDYKEILDIFHLNDVEKIRYKRLPTNLKHRLNLAIAFVNDPDIVFLDEPTFGLDQFSRKEIWTILKQFKEKGKTIFVTTNLAIESEILADRIGIIHNGVIRDIGTPIELIDRYSGGNKIIIRFTNSDERNKAIKSLQVECPLEVIEDEILISSEEVTLFEILAKLDKLKIRYSDVITQNPTMSDVFITLTGEKLVNH